MATVIKLPDGSSKDYAGDVTAAKVAEDISPRLAQAAVAALVDGRCVDLASPIGEGRHELRLVTDRDEQGLEILRHTTAHVMAQAVCRLYGPGVQCTIGPALMDDFQYGFYYDFDLPRPIGAEDLPAIEEAMRTIVAEKLPLERMELPVEQARRQMADLGQAYKVEMIDDLVAKDKVRRVSLYRQGEFLDMCIGPHLSDTGRLKAFKLLTTAGAYWRGDESNKMLTRLYGTAFFEAQALEEHLGRIEEDRKSTRLNSSH